MRFTRLKPFSDCQDELPTSRYQDGGWSAGPSTTSTMATESPMFSKSPEEAGEAPVAIHRTMSPAHDDYEICMLPGIFKGNKRDYNLDAD